jgi:methyl-accepting chemotaxis protein
MTDFDEAIRFKARLAHYAIDDDARARLTSLWPLIQPEIVPAIDEFIKLGSQLPYTAKAFGEHGALLRRLEIHHFEQLFREPFEGAYLSSLHETVRQETAIGLGIRARMHVSSIVGQAALSAVEKKQWFSSGIGSAKVIAKALACDLSMTAAVHDELVANATSRRSQAIDAAIDAFSDVIGKVIGSIQDVSGSLSTTSRMMHERTEETRSRIAAVSAVASETKKSVLATASATEHLSKSINEIAGRASGGVEIAGSAVGDAERTRTSIQFLIEATERVSAVAGLIADIASQTNMLALNATIEAARAGEAGRGFSVVAAEVKALASQTSQATNDIAAQVMAMEQATRSSVGDLSTITETITALAGTVREIAAAVEGQSAATAAISRSVLVTASNTTQTLAEIGSVETATNDSTAVASEIAAWTAALSAEAKTLAEEVKAFFGKVRAA